MFEDLEDDFMEEEELVEAESPPEESSNRGFLIAVGVLGALTVLAIICLGIYLVVIAPRSNNNRAEQQTQASFNETTTYQMEVAAAQTLEAQAWTDTPTVTVEPTETTAPTAVLAQATDTPAEPTEDPRTATVAALLTEAALQPTAETPMTTLTSLPTALPTTGFAEDFGITGLVILAGLAIIVIFLARRLRVANT